MMSLRPCSLLPVCTVVVVSLCQCGDRQPAPPAGTPPTVASATGSNAGGSSGQEPAAPAAIPELQERVRMALSGDLLGHLEPCGCASGQSGGLARRVFQEQQQGNYDLLIEGGNLVAGATELDFQKAYTALDILAIQSRYDVFGIGPHDLQLAFDQWTQLAMAMKVPLVAADLQSTGGAWPGTAFVEKTVRTTKVRVTSLTMSLPDVLTKATPPPLELLAPAAAWQRAMLGADPATLRVVLVHAPSATVRKLAADLQPSPDLVVGITEDYHEPPAHPELAGKVPVVFPGIRGRLLLEVTLARLPDGPRLGYQVHQLARSQTKPGAEEDPAAVDAIRQHRLDVKDQGVLEKLAGQQPTGNGASYLGSESCKQCHPQAYAIWTTTRHHGAWDTLVAAEKARGWPVTAYPDCVACHVVGFGQQSGFVNAQQTPLLANVGCERCHGAGSKHQKAPVQNKLGKVGGGLAAKVCTECHDFEQSPDFEWRSKWAAIKHGKD